MQHGEAEYTAQQRSRILALLLIVKRILCQKFSIVKRILGGLAPHSSYGYLARNSRNSGIFLEMSGHNVLALLALLLSWVCFAAANDPSLITKLSLFNRPILLPLLPLITTLRYTDCQSNTAVMAVQTYRNIIISIYYSGSRHVKMSFKITLRLCQTHFSSRCLHICICICIYVYIYIYIYIYVSSIHTYVLQHISSSSSSSSSKFSLKHRVYLLTILYAVVHIAQRVSVPIPHKRVNEVSYR
jgi:hypothetical protein